MLQVVFPFAGLLPQMLALLFFYHSVETELSISQHGCRVRVVAPAVTLILHQTYNVGTHRVVIKFLLWLLISNRFDELHEVIVLVEIEHDIRHYVLRRRQIDLLLIVFANYLGRVHPPEVVELILAFYNLLLLVNVALVLRVLEEIYELFVFDFVYEECGVISGLQLRNRNKSAKGQHMVNWRDDGAYFL